VNTAAGWNWQAGVRRQWPIICVFLIFVGAFGLVAAGFWRRGALLIGIGVAVGAGLRLLLGEEAAGLLVIRSRALDFATMASAATAMMFIAATIDPLGTS